MKRELEVQFRILRGGAEYGQLYAIGMPTLRCDDSGGIKMSLMGSFAQSDKIDLAAGEAYSLEDDDDELEGGDFDFGGDDDEGGEMDLRILDVSADD